MYWAIMGVTRPESRSELHEARAAVDGNGPGPVSELGALRAGEARVTWSWSAPRLKATGAEEVEVIGSGPASCVQEARAGSRAGTRLSGSGDLSMTVGRYAAGLDINATLPNRASRFIRGTGSASIRMGTCG
jgi:hypothetical protein